MTPQDFKTAFSDEATPEQIELVNRACAEVDEIEFRCNYCDTGQSIITVDNGTIINPLARYVQDCNNQERFIRAAIDGHSDSYLQVMCDVFMIDQYDPSYWTDMEYIACAPQWARFYAAYKVRGGGE